MRHKHIVLKSRLYASETTALGVVQEINARQNCGPLEGQDIIQLIYQPFLCLDSSETEWAEFEAYCHSRHPNKSSYQYLFYLIDTKAQKTPQLYLLNPNDFAAIVKQRSSLVLYKVKREHYDLLCQNGSLVPIESSLSVMIRSFALADAIWQGGGFTADQYPGLHQVINGYEFIPQIPTGIFPILLGIFLLLWNYSQQKRTLNDFLGYKLDRSLLAPIWSDTKAAGFKMFLGMIGYSAAGVLANKLGLTLGFTVTGVMALLFTGLFYGSGHAVGIVSAGILAQKIQGKPAGKSTLGFIMLALTLTGMLWFILNSLPDLVPALNSGAPVLRYLIYAGITLITFFSARLTLGLVAHR